MIVSTIPFRGSTCRYCSTAAPNWGSGHEQAQVKIVHKGARGRVTWIIQPHGSGEGDVTIGRTSRGGGREGDSAASCWALKDLCGTYLVAYGLGEPFHLFP